jgi:predicted nucleic-acid-binding Zn-ribbon protein
MTGMTQEDKDRIIEKLNERGATLPCPRCGNVNFVLLDGYFTQPISNQIGTIVLGGPTVPAVVVACNRCGYMSSHALGVIDVLPPTKEAKK